MKKGLLILAGMIVLISPAVFAVKTEQVELGNNGSYDTKVRIYRDESGNLMFKDEAHLEPVKLLDISQRMTTHGDLSGLGNDDHPQYMDSSRHLSGHSIVFNEALPISPDCGGHMTLGAHLQDADMHLSKNQNEMIMATWQFEGRQEFRHGIDFSLHGIPGKVDLNFMDDEDDARIRWEQGYDYFDFNRKIKGTDLEMNSLQGNTIIRSPGTLDGSQIHSAPTGIIENFVSIEGITSTNLLDKSADEDISGKWDFLNDVYVSGGLVTAGLLDPQGGIKGLGKGNTITVAKSGGDYATIQEAVTAAQSGDVILIFPGTYEVTNLNVNKAISLVGIDSDDCVIQQDNVITGAIGYTSGVVNCTVSGTGLYNLNIDNIGETDGTNTTPAVICSSGVCNIRNCKIKGNGGRDIFCVLNTADVECFGVEVEQYRVASNASHPIWVCNSSSLMYYYSRITVLGTGGGIQLNTTGDCDFCYVYFDTSTYSIDSDACGDLKIYHCGARSGVMFDNAGYSSLLSNFSCGVELNLNFGTITNLNTTNLDMDGAGILRHIDSGDAYFSRLFEEIGENITCVLKWGFGASELYSVYLYGDPENPDTLKTPDNFDAHSIRIDGSERINSSGNGSFAGLSGSTTLWKDFSAISFGGESQITEIASYNKGWKAGYNNQGDPVWHSTHLSCEDEGALKYFPIPYLAGSIITKARVKWQAMGNGDGVKLRIVKRDESGTSSNWTIVGTQQTYTDTGSPYDVTVSVYDFTDETMSANYSYAIEIEAEMASSGVNLFAAGIETSKRVY